MKISSFALCALLPAIVFMTSSCKKSDSCTISGTMATSTTANSTSLQWSGGSAPYLIQYRTSGSATWSTMSSSTQVAQLTGLYPNTTYEWQVQPSCSSVASKTDSFHTSSCTSGYEGTSCATEVRAKYYGSTWMVSGTDDATPPNTYSNMSFTLYASSSSILRIQFQAVNIGMNFDVTLGSDGKSFTVVPFTNSGYSYTGTGNFTDSDHFNLILHELDPSSSSTVTYTFTGTRQ